jgi:hypothetical protein
MSRYSEDPVKHVVSFRVTTEEKDLLEELVKATGVNVSTLLRRWLYLLEEKYRWAIPAPGAKDSL